MRNFRDVDAWVKSHALTLAIYELTKPFPSDELYGLTSQLRRASSSIGANIAEGCGCDTDPDFARFLTMAMRSAIEVENHLLLAKDLGYVKPERHESIEQKVIEVKRMLASFIRKLRPYQCRAEG